MDDYSKMVGSLHLTGLLLFLEAIWNKQRGEENFKREWVQVKIVITIDDRISTELYIRSDKHSSANINYIHQPFQNMERFS